MKISPSITLLSLILVCTSLSACNSTFSYFNKSKVSNTEQPVATTSAPQSNEEKVIIQKIQNNPGISSATVERLAKQNQCTPKEIVNLLTPKGPIEIYRTSCEEGKIFMARCEMRQCKAMPTNE